MSNTTTLRETHQALMMKFSFMCAAFNGLTTETLTDQAMEGFSHYLADIQQQLAELEVAFQQSK